MAVLGYFSLVGLLAASVFFLLEDLDARARALATTQERLARLEGRAAPGAKAPTAADSAAAGSPFLEGPTVTVAGAALQQRVGDAVAKAGGALLSSQIVLDGPQAKQGYVDLTANLEIAQPALQKLLYDLEAGMPYLFVDKLAVQAPRAFGEAESARMRVTVAVSGQWRPAR